MDLTEILKEMKMLAAEAGGAILEIYENAGTVDVEYKEDRMPLTAADKAANRIIVDGLSERFPRYAILSEEEKDNRERLKNRYCFVVDPLDGTKEFLKRNGQFTVNIALAEDGRSVAGVIYVPVTGELYYAGKGIGAFLEAPDKTVTRLHVSDETDKTKLRLVMSNSHGCEQMDRLLEKYGLKNFVKVGSSLKGCMVARGDAEVYYRFNPTMEWDTAAMQCIAEEAGALFRQMDDTEMLYNREDSLNAKGFYIINTIENKLTLSE